jgi:acetamidase/formamidase
VTGPFAVTGATKGQVIEVEIHSVGPDPGAGVGWAGVFRGFGALATESYGIQESVGSELREVPYRDGRAEVDLSGKRRSIPLDPFIGTIGVAPIRERRMSFSQSPEYLGDVDQPGVRAGATLVLRSMSTGRCCRWETHMAPRGTARSPVWRWRSRRSSTSP